jgi:hypothetical protein
MRTVECISAGMAEVLREQYSFEANQTASLLRTWLWFCDLMVILKNRRSSTWANAH